MKKFAIVDSRNNEFYADPIYTDRERAENKIRYLVNYEIENGMEVIPWIIEELTEEREIQHEKEWNMFVSMMD